MGSNFKERDWSRLLAEIQEGEVIPVIGPELLTVETDAGTLKLVDFISQELQRVLELESKTAAPDLTVIADQYIKEGGERHDIYFEFSQICKSLNFPIPEPIRKLIEITDFKVFISTTVDQLLVKAINDIRYGGSQNTKLFSHSSRAEFQDIPLHYGDDTIVYQIFGKAGIAPDYVVTEEDLLLHVQRMRDDSLRPENLFDMLQRKRLLQLGCNFPDWLERFFVSALNSSITSANGGRTVIADTESLKDTSLSEFFNRNKVQIYGGDSHEFVNELHKRWMSCTPPNNENSREVKVSDFEKGSVFISYASEDIKAAENLKDSLNKSGIQVWMDKDHLEAGDDYRNKIFRNIENCSFFIPLISASTLTMDRRFFRLEWNKAQDEAAFRPEGFPFIQPVVIDSTDSSEELIPEFFKSKTHISYFGDGIPDEEYINLCRGRIRELRRKERA